MNKYRPTIGLEIHTELKTRTKMFCDSLNDSLETRPNVNVCPVCLAHPGTLPVPNRAAVESVIRVGLALGASISPISKFDRKNYFYPDLPKGYQISQYDFPLAAGGSLKGVRIRRIHLEEDTGRLLHELPDSTARRHSPLATCHSFVDFNRAGVPLMELVTEPDLKSAEEVRDFARELQLILRYLEVSDADMERGQMRIEANVSLNMGTKVELKNINSFRAVVSAIDYELRRQEDILAGGKKVRHETRGWDDVRQKTVPQRSKEEVHDYRYFAEPDIPPFETDVFEIEKLTAGLPELPQRRRERFSAEFNLSESQAEIIAEDHAVADYFEESVSELKSRRPEGGQITLLFNYLMSDLRGLSNEAGIKIYDSKVAPEKLAHLVSLIEEGKIMSRQAKDIMKVMFETGEDPEAIMDARGMGIITDDSEIEKIIAEVLAQEQRAVEDYKSGKEASLQFLIGRAMGKLKGRGNPDVLKTIILRELSR